MIATDKLLVTIYTDASFKKDHGKFHASFAMYAKCKHGILTKSLPISIQVENATEAEAYGCYIAIKLCKQKWNDMKIAFVNTDSQQTCIKMWPFKYRQKVGGSDKFNSIIKSMKEYCKDNNIEHRFKHVKAHTNGTDIRSWLNDWCDKNAKKERRKSEIQGSPGK